MDALVALILEGADVNAANTDGRTPVHVATVSDSTRTLQLLIAAGADLIVTDHHGQSPLNLALWLASQCVGRIDCACLLIAHCVWLETVPNNLRESASPLIRMHQGGVLRCRQICVALMSIKRRRAHALHGWDRFLVREMAFAWWSTRFDSAWQPLDWNCTVRWAGQRGELMALLETLPRERWIEKEASGLTMLHYASYGGNQRAARALLAHGLDINARNLQGLTPSHVAANRALPRVLEMFCVAGADLRAVAQGPATPLDCALVSQSHSRLRGAECVRVLLLNGVRLSTAEPQYHHHITPALWAFERGLLPCRAAVVAILNVKWRRGLIVPRLGRFVVQEIALAIWVTRVYSAWQPLVYSAWQPLPKSRGCIVQ